MRPPLDPPKGMDDLTPEEYAVQDELVKRARAVMEAYGYRMIETPAVEHYEVFAVKSGEEILTHMFGFEDAHGRRLVLRPEMTAPVARLFAARLSRRPLPVRLGYVADCYRLDEPQWGRRRRFYHAGFELIGVRDPMADAEQVLICRDFFESVGIRDFRVKLGHVGIHRAVLSACGLDESSQDRVLSLIDRGRREEAMGIVRDAPGDPSAKEAYLELVSIEGPAEVGEVRELLSRVEGTRAQVEELEAVFRVLEALVGRDRIGYVPGFARGLSYYTGVIFEVYGPRASVALAGGGRYDGLIGLFGGRDFPGVGVAIGITRVMQYLVDRMGYRAEVGGPKVLVKPLTRSDGEYALMVADSVRRRGIAVETAFPGRSLGDELGLASERGVRLVLIVGARERERGVVLVRDMREGRQLEVQREGVAEEVERLLGHG
ncbi:MAG: histidine--tRNA ligase [Nitrososphaerota archaeon]